MTEPITTITLTALAKQSKVWINWVGSLVGLCLMISYVAHWARPTESIGRLGARLGLNANQPLSSFTHWLNAPIRRPFLIVTLVCLMAICLLTQAYAESRRSDDLSALDGLSDPEDRTSAREEYRTWMSRRSLKTFAYLWIFAALLAEMSA